MAKGSRMGTRWGRLVVPVGLVAALAGCGSSPAKTTTPPAPTTSVATTTPTTAPATTAPSPSVPPTTAATVTTTTTPAGPKDCASDQLTVSLGASGAGVGHAGIGLRFRNTGTAPCVLHGYPGVAMLDAAGHQVVQAVRTPSGYLGGLPAGSSAVPTVTLGPGQTASALLEGTDVPTGSASTCPVYPSALVTPPNTTTSVRLKLAPAGSMAGLPGCSPPQVHPIVAGTTGNQA